MTQAGLDVEPGAPRRVTLRCSRTVRLASAAFALVCAAAVHVCATAHVGAIDALWLSGAALAALGVSFVRHERGQPASIELTPEGVAAFDRTGRPLFQGRIVGFAQWAERVLVLAVAGGGMRRAKAFVVAADAVDAAAFRALAVRGRHATH
ncbi:protein YgfX [Trinickia dinghuensis]|uniref:RNA polymerase subunit sigma n=1 Tax=Trinickia dinghuensis TaxID=2291023 RepID=A0A3D8JVG9_9BURK|nr:protein YgfX [Trinickia dinghuensis]RDU97098.1 RNA polymerase subunit sigma [Trinickia dinghuensis]